MPNWTHGLAAALLAVAPVELSAAAPETRDAEAVRAAVLDYVESIYKVDPARVERSVGQDLNKMGVVHKRQGSEREPRMTYEQLRELAAKYNAAGRVPADSVKMIDLLDLQSHIANAKLEAVWGVDYLLLTKGPDGKWKIRQVLWQPLEKPSPGTPQQSN